MKCLWTTIMVKNMDVSLNFYSSILNMEIDSRFQAGPNSEITFLCAGEIKFELICNRDIHEISHSKYVSTGFQVNSVDKTIEHLKKCGISKFSEIISPNPKTKFFFVKDPDGYQIQLVELAE